MSENWIGKVDLAQIECRMLNTVAGQWDVVEKFRNGIDLYSELASQFYGFHVDKSKPAERGTGKQLELSCGYGAGGPTIVRTARAGTYGPPVYLTEEQGMQARDLYRSTHKYVKALWEKANQVLWVLYEGGTQPWGVPGSGNRNLMTVSDHRVFHDASGLWLDFTTLERVTLDSGDEVWRHRVRDGYRKTYGARLVENIIQWLSRMVISEAMVRVHRNIGVKMPLTVHDDIFMVIPKTGVTTPSLGYITAEECLAECRKLIEKPLTWLPECPISAEADPLLEALSSK